MFLYVYNSSAEFAPIESRILEYINKIKMGREYVSFNIENYDVASKIGTYSGAKIGLPGALSCCQGLAETIQASDIDEIRPDQAVLSDLEQRIAQKSAYTPSNVSFYTNPNRPWNNIGSEEYEQWIEINEKIENIDRDEFLDIFSENGVYSSMKNTWLFESLLVLESQTNQPFFKATNHQREFIRANRVSAPRRKSKHSENFVSQASIAMRFSKRPPNALERKSVKRRVETALKIIQSKETSNIPAMLLRVMRNPRRYINFILGRD